MRAGKGIRFRTKLTLWYLGVFVAFFVTLEAYNYNELRSVLLDSIDTALAAEADRTAEDIDIGTGNLFSQSGDTAQAPISAAAATFSFRVVDASGAAIGHWNDFPSIASPSRPLVGFATTSSEGHDYRIVTREIPSTSAPGTYYIQASHSLDAIEKELTAAVGRFMLVLPVILLFAALGGFLFATTALKPIRRLTRVAESIRDDRLALRSRYEGPDDEIGRLARSFDGMLDRLEASFIREKRFSADASHELRTPLAALKGGIEVMLSRRRSADDYEAALRGMKDEVDRLVSLSADLLLLARMGSAAVIPEEGGVRLDALLESCAAGLADKAEERGLVMSLDLETNLVVAGSRDHLARLFMNLLENAVKYANEGGTVTLRSEREGDRAIVRIGNTGPGVSALDLDHVFDPFFRGDTARSRRSGGAGLGLAIAREIAEAHSGSLSLASTENVETLATVAIPIEKKHSA